METASGRLLALDGLRGVAAIAAAAYDLSEAIGWRQQSGFFAHGYLAADFFFCLSGFVLAKGYGDQLASEHLSFERFCLLRLIRLLPLMAIVAGLSFLVRLALVTAGDPVGNDTVARLLVNLPFGLVTLPQYVPNQPSAFAYPLNPVAWFVFADLVVSLIWALVLSRVRVAIGGALVGLCLIALLPTAVAANTLDFGAARGVAPWLPIIRAAVSFLIGATLWRHSRGKTDEIFYLEIPATCIWIVLWLPVDLSWAFDIVCVVLLFPIVILFSAEAKVLVIGRPVLRFLGEISYPLFAIHSLLLLAMIKFSELRPALLAPADLPLVTAGLVLCAWLVFRYAELPIRSWLARRLI